MCLVIFYVFGIEHCVSLCLSILGMPHRVGTTFGFGAQGRDPASQETRQQHAVEDDMQCCVHKMGAQVDRWKRQMGDLQRAVACNMLRCPLLKGPDGRRERGQAAQRVGVLVVCRWHRFW